MQARISSGSRSGKIGEDLFLGRAARQHIQHILDHAWWERTADTFVQVAGGSSFATKATLNTTLDTAILAHASIDITFNGDDWDLEETTLEEATTTQPLQGLRLGNGESRIGPTWCACKESPLPSVLRIGRSTIIATLRCGNSAAVWSTTSMD